MECFVIFVMAWCWCNATESKPQNVGGQLEGRNAEENQTVLIGVNLEYISESRLSTSSLLIFLISLFNSVS